jgi:hypothetical protein
VSITFTTPSQCPSTLNFFKKKKIKKPMQKIKIKIKIKIALLLRTKRKREIKTSWWGLPCKNILMTGLDDLRSTVLGHLQNLPPFYFLQSYFLLCKIASESHHHVTWYNGPYLTFFFFFFSFFLFYLSSNTLKQTQKERKMKNKKRGSRKTQSKGVDH